MENKLILIGALGAFFLATAATLVSDLRGIGDWIISALQVQKHELNPASIYGTPYTIAGYFGEPLLMIAIAMLTTGLHGCWLKYHQSIKHGFRCLAYSTAYKWKPKMPRE